MTALNSSRPLVIQQAEDGYRYSIEPFLLADFVHLSPGCQVLDVGTGCGVIPLLLATRGKANKIIAIEIQQKLYDLAVSNISDNGAEKRVRLIYDDFANWHPDATSELFDVVISNPPYRKIKTGRINPNHEKAVARHELSMSLESLTAGADDCLKEGGAFTLAYPPLRLAEVLERLCRHKLFPARLRFIHGSRDAEARIFLVEAIKGRRADCVIEPPLYVYNEDGSYSREMEKIYASFNYSSRADNVEEK